MLITIAEDFLLMAAPASRGSDDTVSRECNAISLQMLLRFSFLDNEAPMLNPLHEIIQGIECYQSAVIVTMPIKKSRFNTLSLLFVWT
jgi:hypothetical protein